MESKYCTDCQQELDVELFLKLPNRRYPEKFHYSTYCRKCRNNRRNELKKKDPLNKQKVKDRYWRSKRRKNGEEIPDMRDKLITYTEEQVEQFRIKKLSERLNREYKLEYSEYLKMLKDQEGLCLICGKSEKLVVDHNHNTGKVRGLLCFNCNVGIGFLKEDISNFIKAIEYIKTKNEST